MQAVPATEELLAIHARIRACIACPLHATRTQAVPGYGPAGAAIIAVGEAPGETEDREGRPFVGAAGRLLTELVESIGLSRRDLYITNVLKCRPPGNRDPQPSEVEACSAWLDEQIELHRPEVILVLGRHALARLIPGSAGISRLHGQRIVRGDRVYVPLYHPAAALYNGSLRQTLFADMQRVRGHLDEARRLRAAREREREVAAEAQRQSAEAAARAGDQLSLFAP